MADVPPVDDAHVVAVMPSMSDLPTPFEVSLQWAPGGVVVAASGEIDMLTAPVLGGILGALGERHAGTLVLDMAEVSFMDAAGLGVLALTSSTRQAHGSLTIRSPGPTIRWLLDHFGLSGVVEPTTSALPTSTVRSLAAAAQQVLDPERSRAVVDPARNELVDAALRLVTALAQATIGGADGVSVSIAREGQLTTVAATDETIAEMDRDQYATGEGPCLSAAAEGLVFHVDALADELRWPKFIPRAINDGIGSILSNPLVVATRPVGALNIYSKLPRGFGPRDQELASMLAAAASDMLAEGGFDVADAAVAARLLRALRTRAVISQAQGVVMAQQGGSPEAAFASLRDSSKQTGIPIREWASDIVAGTHRHALAEEAPT